MSSPILGVDLGTSALKAVLLDQCRALACASAPLGVDRPLPGRAEQDPRAWWAALERALGALKRDNATAFEAVSALALTGQMHGLLPLDRASNPLRPCILWNDGRAADQARELNRRLTEAWRTNGVPVAASFPIAKWPWLRRHEPEIASATAKLLLPKDYLALRLTGETATDAADGAGTGWLDQASGAWDAEAMEAGALEPGLLPRLHPPGSVIGELGAQAAGALSLRPGTPVLACGGDTPCAAVGSGVVGEGDALLQIGTSAQLLVADDAYRPQRLGFVHAYAHAVAGRYYRMAALLNGGSCLRWVADLAGERDHGLLVAKAEHAFAGPSRLTFLPYLAGERTPLGDPDARGALIGLDAGAGAADVALAVLEGVALALADAQDAVFGRLEAGTPEADRADAGAAAPRVVSGYLAAGGGTANPFWLRLIASALNAPIGVTAPVAVEGSAQGPSPSLPAVGAARLAARALDAGHDLAKPPVSRWVEPDPELAQAYRAKLKGFRALQRALIASPATPTRPG